MRFFNADSLIISLQQGGRLDSNSNFKFEDTLQVLLKRVKIKKSNFLFWD